MAHAARTPDQRAARTFTIMFLSVWALAILGAVAVWAVVIWGVVSAVAWLVGQ